MQNFESLQDLARDLLCLYFDRPRLLGVFPQISELCVFHCHEYVVLILVPPKKFQKQIRILNQVSQRMLIDWV